MGQLDFESLPTVELIPFLPRTNVILQNHNILCIQTGLSAGYCISPLTQTKALNCILLSKKSRDRAITAMDFAALMSKEISKKRGSSPTNEPAKKYMKRADVEAERKTQYLNEQRAMEAQREAKAAQKRQKEEEEAEAARVREEKTRKFAEELKRRREEQEAEEERARRKRLGLPELVKEESVEIDDDDIPEDELVEKLRAMGHPAKLFGEGHRQKLRRFRKLGVVMTQGPIPTSLELVDEKDMKVETVPEDAEGKKYLFRQLASYFTMVLKEWESALDKEKRDTFASKAAYNAMVSSKENMTPVSH